MPYDRSAYVRGRRRGGGQRRAALTLTVHVTGMMMDTMKGLDVADMMTESVTDHGEPDMNPGIRIPVVDGKEIAPGRVHSTPDVLQVLR